MCYELQTLLDAELSDDPGLGAVSVAADDEEPSEVERSRSLRRSSARFGRRTDALRRVPMSDPGRLEAG